LKTKKERERLLAWLVGWKYTMHTLIILWDEVPQFLELHMRTYKGKNFEYGEKE